MKKGTPVAQPHRRGSPRAAVDPGRVRQYARVGLKTTEIAGLFGCDEGVIRRRFGGEVQAGRGERVVALRLAQHASMTAGDTAMLIFLGKNELGQADRVRAEVTGPGGGPIVAHQAKPPFDWAAYRRLRAERDRAGGGGDRPSPQPDHARPHEQT